MKKETSAIVCSANGECPACQRSQCLLSDRVEINAVRMPRELAEDIENMYVSNERLAAEMLKELFAHVRTRLVKVEFDESERTFFLPNETTSLKNHVNRLIKDAEKLSLKGISQRTQWDDAAIKVSESLMTIMPKDADEIAAQIGLTDWRTKWKEKAIKDAEREIKERKDEIIAKAKEKAAAIIEEAEKEMRNKKQTEESVLYRKEQVILNKAHEKAEKMIHDAKYIKAKTEIEKQTVMREHELLKQRKAKFEAKRKKAQL